MTRKTKNNLLKITESALVTRKIKETLTTIAGKIPAHINKLRNSDKMKRDLNKYLCRHNLCSKN